MICSVPLTDIDNDKVFSALADKNRRKIVELLHKKDSTILDLSSSFSVSFQGLSKHIKVLEDAQVVTKTRKGKYMVCSLNRQALKSSLNWMNEISQMWNSSFDRLDNLIEKDKHDTEKG